MGTLTLCPEVRHIFCWQGEKRRISLISSVMLLQKRANQASFKFNKQQHYWCLLYQHIFSCSELLLGASINLLPQDEEVEAPRVSEIKSHIQEEMQPEWESRSFLKAHGLKILKKNKKSSITSVILVYQSIWKNSKKEENQFLTLTPSGGSTNIVVLSVWSFCCVYFLMWVWTHGVSKWTDQYFKHYHLILKGKRTRYRKCGKDWNP